MVVVKGRGKGRLRYYCFMGIEFPFYTMKRVLEIGHTNVSILNTTELYTKKWLRW